MITTKRTLTSKQIRRVKIMCLLMVGGVMFSSTGVAILHKLGVDAIDGVDASEVDPAAPRTAQELSVTYVWQGTSYQSYDYNPQPKGYVQEYTNAEAFCHSALLLPGTSLVSEASLGVACLIILLYLFLGIAIVADLFMEAIEVITSSKVVVYVMDPTDPGKTIPIEKDFWNPTIANLTLLALGSSMPEILLSIFSTVGDLDGIPSELGPMGIVGSAAFNLFVITAVSITAVTEGNKKILDVGVFIWTAFASSFSYLWFLLTLSMWSPDEIEIWEACATIGGFLLLCLVALGLDKWTSAKNRAIEHQQNTQKDAAKYVLKQLQTKLGTLDLIKTAQNQKVTGQTKQSTENVRSQFKMLLGEKEFEAASFEDLFNVITNDNQLERFTYRKQIAAAAGTGGVKSFANLKDLKGQVVIQDDVVKVQNDVVGFKNIHYSVMENAGDVTLTIVKQADCKKRIEFNVKTFADSAQDNEDFSPIDELVTMEPDQFEKVIHVSVVDDEKQEPDKVFYVEIGDMKTKKRMDGDDTRCKVTIIDDDSPGTVGFKTRVTTKRPQDTVLEVELVREEGCSGECSVVLVIQPVEDKSLGQAAKEGVDFEPLKDPTVTFAADEKSKTIEIAMPKTSLNEPLDAKIDSEIKPDDEECPPSANFAIEITKPYPEGLKLSRKKKHLVEIRPSIVALDDEAENERNSLLKEFMNASEPAWGQQFIIACMLGPTIDENGCLDDVTCGEAVVHWLAIPWKLFFAIIPPRKKCGGWAAFSVALAQIGIVTFVVGEVAGLLGCAIGLKTSVTAITLVALGTSLPDTFASMSAAKNSPYADSAVGNVTGSNAVNVFLGMGCPWMIASIYNHVNYGTAAPVPKGDLVFAVTVFLCCSAVCFFVLFMRRQCIGGELGGPPTSRYVSAGILVGLWVIFVVLCTLNAYGALGERLPPPQYRPYRPAVSPSV